MLNLLLTLLATSPLAHAQATPTPDRPTRGYAGHLISEGTLELETGWFTQEGAHAVPTMLKFGGQGWEPRVGFDVAGVTGNPGAFAGLKVHLLGDGALALSAMAESAIPIGDTEAWAGKGWLLFDAGLGEHVGVNVNTGVDLVDAGGVQIYGVPLVLGLSTPLFSSVSLFGEAAAELVDFEQISNVLFDAGLQWSPTSIVILDAAAGYEPGPGSLWITVGGVVNFGRVGG